MIAHRAGQFYVSRRRAGAGLYVQPISVSLGSQPSSPLKTRVSALTLLPMSGWPVALGEALPSVSPEPQQQECE